MEFRLPRKEDTEIRILSEGKEPIVMDLLDLDDMHVDASSLAAKKKIEVHEAFSLLFQEAHGISFNRAQTWLLLTFKKNKIDELKKNCTDLPSSSSSTDSLQESTSD